MNPLLKPYNTVFGTVPFEEIKEEHFLPALKEAIQIAKQEVETLVANTSTPNFKNTIEVLEKSGEAVSRVSEVFFNLNSAETNDEIQKIAREFSPLLTAYGNDMIMHKALFERVKHVHDNKTSENLNREQEILLDKTYKSFVRNGALLSEEDQQHLREIDKKLSGLSLQFGENVLKATHSFELHLTDKEDLKGIPESAKEAAAELAKELEKEGWVFTLQYPSYIPFVTYADNRSLREKMTKAFGGKAFKDGDTDNTQIILELTKLRYERAVLLGFKDHADYVLQERMAGSSKKVISFLKDLLDAAKPIGEKEVKELTAYAVKNGGPNTLQKWDFAYYSEKLKQAQYEIDDELLKPYFSLEEVLQGTFKVAHKLYGISFIENTEIQKYHKDVQTFEVRDENNQHLAVFYADFFPRKGKRNGAWMTSYRAQKVEEGKDVRPHISIVCNFTKPTSTTPSLLTFNEVLTLFHEFGHALHGILAKGTYASLSGTSVYWDFVELPSQIMENWCYEKDCLDLFAKHYKTKETIPSHLVEKLKASAAYMQGYATVRQVGLATLDMAWHASSLKNVKDVGAYENEVLKVTELLPSVEGNNTSCSFSHIFQGGYSSGYYSYKWAEVLDADAFEYFKEKGIFNKEVADKFRILLSSGGGEHPLTLYKNFRGKEADPKALLRRSGLIK